MSVINDSTVKKRKCSLNNDELYVIEALALLSKPTCDNMNRCIATTLHIAGETCNIQYSMCMFLYYASKLECTAHFNVSYSMVKNMTDTLSLEEFEFILRNTFIPKCVCCKHTQIIQSDKYDILLRNITCDIPQYKTLLGQKALHFFKILCLMDFGFNKKILYCKNFIILLNYLYISHPGFSKFKIELDKKMKEINEFIIIDIQTSVLDEIKTKLLTFIIQNCTPKYL